MREEGHYTLKRVVRLPKKGNLSLLYAFIGDTIDTLYRFMPNGEYEEIKLGASVSAGTVSAWLKQLDDSVSTDITDDVYTKGKVGINTNSQEYAFDVQSEEAELTPLTGTFSFDPNTYIITGVGSQILSEFDYNAQYEMPDGNTYNGFDFSPTSDTEMYFFPFPTPPAFTGQQISKSVVSDKLFRVGSALEVSEDTVKVSTNMSQIGDFLNFNREGKNITNFFNILDSTGTLSQYFRYAGNKVSSFFRRNSSPVNGWGIELFSNTNFRRLRFDEYGNLFYINAPNATNNSSYTKNVVAKADGTIALEDKSGGSSGGNPPFVYKPSSRNGIYEIKVPSIGTNFSITIKIYKAFLGMSEYTISAYLNNPNGWVQTSITKTAQNNSALETVTLTDNGSAGDFRIYIGDPSTPFNTAFHTLYITEAYQSGIFQQSSSVYQNNIFPVDTVTSITGTVKATN